MELPRYQGPESTQRKELLYKPNKTKGIQNHPRGVGDPQTPQKRYFKLASF
jgi:hypothetical protein